MYDLTLKELMYLHDTILQRISSNMVKYEYDTALLIVNKLKVIIDKQKGAR